MAKKTGETSAKVASKAAKVLKDPKATKDAKSVAASALKQTKAPAKAAEKVVEPPRYTPMIGEWCEMSGKLITIQNFDPFEAKEWYVMDNVICDRPFTEPDFENVRPVSAEERYARLR